MNFLLRGLAPTAQGYVLFNVTSHLIALAVMLPATFCAGMTLPLFTTHLLRVGYGERSIGNIYAANTLGAIVGVLFAVQVGLPWLSVKGTIELGALLDIALGVLLLRSVGRQTTQWMPRAALAASAVVFLGIALAIDFDPRILGSGVYRKGYAPRHRDTEVRYYRDGKTASVLVRSQSNTLFDISTNGKPDASIMMTGDTPAPDEPTQVLVGTLPLAFDPDARRAAVIGFGSGQSTHALLHSPHIERVDTIEIEAAMVEGAGHFRPLVERAFTDPRSHIHLDDAKAFFARQRERYDIIISEPSNPWVSGVSSLFAEEFYPRVSKSLTDDGLLVQWIQLYEIDMDLVGSIIKALDPHFDDYVLYMPEFSNVIVIAKKRGKLPAPNTRFLFETEMARILTRIGINGPADIDIRRLASREPMIAMFERYPTPANSDYFPVLDLGAPRARFMRSQVKGVGGVAVAPLPVVAMLDDHPHSYYQEAVTPTDSLPRSRMAAAARRFVGEMTGTLSADPDDPYPMQDVAAALKAQLNVEGCVIHYRSLLDELYEMATTVHSVISPEELTGVWATLDQYRCVETLNPRLQTWMKLFKATTTQHPAHMVTAAETLLAEQHSEEDPSHREYQVAALITGHLALDAPIEAMQTIKTRAPQLLESSGGAPYLQLLTGLTNRRLKSAQNQLVDVPSTGTPKARATTVAVRPGQRLPSSSPGQAGPEMLPVSSP